MESRNGRPARAPLVVGLLFLALGTCGAPFPRAALEVQAAQTAKCGSAADFYRTHPGTALWVRGGKLTPRGQQLADLLSRADEEGLDASRYEAAPEELQLSAAYLRFLRDLSVPPPKSQLYYVDPQLQRTGPCASRMLDRAAASPALDQVVEPFRRPNPVAAQLRSKLAATQSPGERRKLSADLALARSLGSPARFVLVDVAAQRLSMIEGSAAVDRMKVVVGKAGMETPSMAGLIRYAVVNPYWYIPPDLVQHEIAPRAASAGSSYLAEHRYEPVTAYDESGVSVEPAAVDWTAVRAGEAKIGLRQLPGADNMMGRVMFMFPNRLGIYLHDTPARWVFGRADRRLSHGCVRLENAAALYRWLFDAPLEPAARRRGADAHVPLREPVPVFIVNFQSGSGANISPATDVGV